MFTRPIYQNIAAQNSAYWHDAVYEKIGCKKLSFQVIPMYQQSIESKAAARYFLINQKNTLVFKGDDVIQNVNERDVRAEWLRLPCDFIGTFSLMPKQKQFGVWMELNKDLATFTCNKYFQSLWVAAAFPYQEVRNNLQPSECIVSTGTVIADHKSIVSAFNDTRMCFGKISPKRTKRRSISEIYLKLGNTFMNDNGFQIGAYTGVIFPTFGHQNPEFMFNAFLGHDRHFGFVSGLNFQFALNCDTDCKLIALIFSIENQYYLRNYEHRTFDLRFKPWSRYMLFNQNDGTKNISGVNVLSPRCKIQPFNFVDLTAGFRVQSGWLEAELGYNMWAHGDEEVQLQKPFPEIYGIAGDGTLVPGTNIGATASASKINELAAIDKNANGQPTFVPIHEYDLDFKSAAARGVVAHRAYASLSFVLDQCTFALFWGLGSFVEIPQNNTALWNWGVWGKVGGIF